MEKIIHKKTIGINEFIANFRDERFLKFCKECKCYTTNWACPPLSFEPTDFLRNFGNIEVFAVQIKFSESEIEASAKENITKYGKKILNKVQLEYCKKFLEREKTIPSSLSLFPGSCVYCEKCSRIDNKPCRFPEKMRYSMDALNFDLTKIMNELFSIDLLWGKDRLPKYYCLIYGFLTK